MIVVRAEPPYRATGCEAMELDLPPLPGSQVRALAIVGQAEVDFRELSKVVESDPSLTAAVLRAANSAMSSPLGRIETADQGLVRIGVERARRIIAGAIVSGNTSGLGRANLDVTELWRHLVASALIADVAAWGEVRRSASFTAGLLHDIGRLGMAHVLPTRYAEVVALVRGGAETIEAEQHVFGVDHLAVGAEIARAWNVPDDIAEAIGDHHHAGAPGALTWVTWKSRRIVKSLGIGDGVQPPEEPAELAPEDAKIIATLGGVERLESMIAWYTGAMTAVAA
jgi:putative nucleotidyltransferase with HDIG domain